MAFASGEIIQLNPPRDDEGWSMAVSDSEHSSCKDETILVRLHLQVVTKTDGRDEHAHLGSEVAPDSGDAL